MTFEKSVKKLLWGTCFCKAMALKLFWPIKVSGNARTYALVNSQDFLLTFSSTLSLFSVGKGGVWSDDCRADGTQGNPGPVPREGEEIRLSSAEAHCYGQRTEEPHLWAHQSQERCCHWSKGVQHCSKRGRCGWFLFQHFNWIWAQIAGFKILKYDFMWDSMGTDSSVTAFSKTC